MPRELVAASKGDGSGPLGWSQVEVTDFDADGDLDLLVRDRGSHNRGGKFERHGFVWLYRRTNSAGSASAPRGTR